MRSELAVEANGLHIWTESLCFFLRGWFGECKVSMVHFGRYQGWDPSESGYACVHLGSYLDVANLVQGLITSKALESI